MIHICVPTEEADEQVKDECYLRLQDAVDNRNKHDMLVITGDTNAKVGDRNVDFERVMGKHGLRIQNDNGERLCEMCDVNELVITGTLFPYKGIHKQHGFHRM